MAFITFIYTIGNNKKYYGKFVTNSISNYLELESKQNLKSAISVFRTQNGHSILNKPIRLGVLSYSYSDFIPHNEDEIHCFDFYCIKQLYDKKTYMNGKLLFSS